jgi:microcystin degradation protein MlrC
MARIAIGGFQHETNTFAPAKAAFADFAEGGGWPGLQRGASLPANMAGLNLPVSGGIAELKRLGHEIVPLVWAAATPSAHVTEDAFERIAAMLLEDLAALGPFDGVYLDLHGAMVTEHLEDGEGELLRRVRRVVGPAVPVAASLDLHANVTAEMVTEADLLVAYRTYPHVDMAATGARAARLLHGLVGGRRLHKAFRQADFLIPLTWQCTLMEPARSLYANFDRIEGSDVDSVSFTPGFPAADISDCGPAVLAYGTSQSAAERAADALIAEIAAKEREFAGRLYTPDEGVRAAMARARTATRPVVLADTQDNPGAGGSSDTVGLLEALVRHGAEGAVLAILADPESAAAAHAAGGGATLEFRLGGKSGAPGQAPFRTPATVERLGDGNFTGTGPMWGGVPCRLGPMALLRIGGVRVVVASKKLQAADQAIFRHLGVEPAAQPILALKSSVHFRADFQPIAEEILVVAAPGAMAADPATLPFRRLRPGVRLNPLGPVLRA